MSSPRQLDFCPIGSAICGFAAWHSSAMMLRNLIGSAGSFQAIMTGSAPSGPYPQVSYEDAENILIFRVAFRTELRILTGAKKEGHEAGNRFSAQVQGRTQRGKAPLGSGPKAPLRLRTDRQNELGKLPPWGLPIFFGFKTTRENEAIIL